MNSKSQPDGSKENGSNSEQEASKQAKRTTLTRTLPTDRVTFATQLDILRAYPAAYEKSGTAVTLEELKGFVAVAPATISLTNAFFCDVGLLRKDGRKFVPCSELQSMLRLWGINQEGAWRKLGSVFQRSWIGDALVPKLRYKRLTEDEAVQDLAEASTAEAGHVPQLRIIIDYIVLVGLVCREGGQLRLVNHDAGPEANTELLAAAKPPELPAGGARIEKDLPSATLFLDPTGERRFVVQSPPTITGKELERIKRWLEVQLIVEDPVQTPKT